jgi:predicted alpha/beta hydrolase
MVRTLGHMPGWAIGGGEPLPAQVALQWSDWGVRETWAFSDPAMHAHCSASRIVAPVHLWGVSDDLTYAPPRAVDALAGQFANAAVQRHQVSPAELGVARIGHFGAFRREPGARLWPRMLEPVEAAMLALSRCRI